MDKADEEELEEGEIEEDNGDCPQPESTPKAASTLSRNNSTRNRPNDSARNYSSPKIPLQKQTSRNVKPYRGMERGPPRPREWTMKSKSYDSNFQRVSSEPRPIPRGSYGARSAWNRRYNFNQTRKYRIRPRLNLENPSKEFVRKSQDEYPNEEPTYETLLAQYKMIQSQLEDLKREEAVIVPSLKEIEGLDKENLKSKSTDETDTKNSKSRKISSDAHRSSRLRSRKKSRSRQRSQSHSKTDTNLEQKPVELVLEDEDEEELRKIALASAQNKKPEISNMKSTENLQFSSSSNLLKDPNVFPSDPDIETMKRNFGHLFDNYEEVAMDLDSNSDSPEEDEDLLRAQLLCSLAQKQKEKAEKATDIPFQPTPNVPVNTPETTSSPLMSLPPVHKPVVINLAEDSSESESDTDVSFFPNLDLLLRQARNSADLSQKTPQAVYQLSHSQVEEYHRLKEEIAKREQLKKKAVVADTKQFPTLNSRVEELKGFEQKLQKQRIYLTQKESTLQTLKRTFGKKQELLKTAEQKQKTLEEQLAAVHKIILANKTSLKKLNSQISLLENKVKDQKVMNKNLEALCITVGKIVHPDNYSLPAYPQANVKRRASISISQSLKKRRIAVVRLKNGKPLNVASADNKNPSVPRRQVISSQSTLTAEQLIQKKARLQKLFEECAAKLNDLRRTAAAGSNKKISNVQEILSNKSHAKVEEPIDLHQITNTPDSIESNSHIVIKTVSKELPSDERLKKSSFLPSGDLEDEVKSKHLCEVSFKKLLDYYPHMLKEIQEEFSIPKLDVALSYNLDVLFSSFPNTTFSDVIVPDDLLNSSAKQNPEELKHWSPYTSVLTHLKSYRLNPYFRTKESCSLTWSKYTQKIDPTQRICPFDLMGMCNDDQCPWQHEKEYNLSDQEVLSDLIAYAPKLAVIKETDTSEEQQSSLSTYADSLLKSTQDKLTLDELCLHIVGKVNENLRAVPPNFVLADSRSWKPKTVIKEKKLHFITEDAEVTDVAFKHPLGLSGLDHELDEDDVRYYSFSSDKETGLETAVLEDPHNIQLWIKLAYWHLSRKHCNSIGLDQSLNVLSRALEKNRNSSELWLQYLHLYQFHKLSKDIFELCQQAVEFAPSLELWWKCLSLTKGINNKLSICSKLTTFILSSDVSTDVKSHQVLEILFFQVNLYTLSGYFKNGVNLIQKVLQANANDKEFGPLNLALVAEDRCLAWLCYIHLVVFQVLPDSLFDPSNDNPGHIVNKKPFIINWREKKNLNSSMEQLLGLFQEAFHHCLQRSLPTHINTITCLPLYRNLIALELSRERFDSVIGICRRLLEAASSVEDIWILLASVTDLCGKVEETKMVFLEAIEHLPMSSRLYYMAAQFEMKSTNFEAALKVIYKCIRTFYKDLPSDISDEMLTSLFSSLIGLPVLGVHPIPDIDPVKLKEENCQAYLLLIYCILLELKGNYVEAVSALENGLSKLHEFAHILWLHYLQMELRKISCSSKKQQEFNCWIELVRRCLITNPVYKPAPHNCRINWLDYSFHNQVAEMYLTVLPEKQQLKACHQLYQWMPSNIHIVKRLIKLYISFGEVHRISPIISEAFHRNLCSVSLTKTVFEALAQESRSEVPTLFKEALRLMPYALPLWKCFIIWEVSNGQIENAKKLVEQCHQFNLNIDDFLQSVIK